MDAYICRTCAVQYAPSEQPPERCIICEDERQYVNWAGQQWTTLAELKAQGYKNVLREHEPGLTGIGVEPHLGIGQRALLVQTPQGNVLWDCIGYIDDEAVAQVRERAGIVAIAVSHPHFYGAMVEWAHAFDAPICIPEVDRRWFTRTDARILTFEDATILVPGVTLIQTGGHFPGSTVLHWAAGAEGRGVLLTGDSIQVVQDRRFVSFMWSYPNLLPLPASAITGIVRAVRSYSFDRIYGGWWHTIMESGAQEALYRSAERYIKLGDGENPGSEARESGFPGEDHVEPRNLPHACPLIVQSIADSDEPDDPDYPFVYVDTYREYGIRIFDGGSSFLVIHFCPFCGAELPPSLRDEWFERLDELGLEPGDPRIPPEMHDGTWWRSRSQAG